MGFFFSSPWGWCASFVALVCCSDCFCCWIRNALGCFIFAVTFLKCYVVLDDVRLLFSDRPFQFSTRGFYACQQNDQEAALVSSFTNGGFHFL